MTKDEIEKFVDETIRDGWDRVEMVKAITDRWVEDVEDAIAEAGEVTDADACGGPCCARSAYEPLSTATPDSFVEVAYGIDWRERD